MERRGEIRVDRREKRRNESGQWRRREIRVDRRWKGRNKS